MAKGDHHISFLILSGVSAREITLLFGDAAFDEAKKSSKHLQQTPWCLSSLDAIVGYRMELRRIDVKGGHKLRPDLASTRGRQNILPMSL